MKTEDAEAAYAAAQPVFAVVPDGNGDGVPIVIVALHEAAWEHIRDGDSAEKTVNFDFTGLGLLAKLVIFGAPDRSSALATIESVVGKPDIDLRGQCFGIAELSTRTNDH